ncbi:MAG: hypothetical protein IPI62_14535 [Bacteroidetes bacterium]|nr:hypothetical protein [Bacteroidota bacterium]
MKQIIRMPLRKIYGLFTQLSTNGTITSTLCIYAPFGFVLRLFCQRARKLISGVAYSIVRLQLAGLFLFSFKLVIAWSIDFKFETLCFYKEDTIEIFLDFYFDKSNNVLLLLVH